MQYIQHIKDFHTRTDLNDNLLYQAFKKAEIIAIVSVIVAAVAIAIFLIAPYMPTLIRGALMVAKVGAIISVLCLFLYMISRVADRILHNVHTKIGYLNPK